MGHGKGFHVEIPDAERHAGGEDAPLQAPALPSPLESLDRGRIRVELEPVAPVQHLYAGHVVGVFVRQADRGDPPDADADLGQAPDRFPGRQTGVDQEPGCLGPHKRAGTGAPAAQRTQPQAHTIILENPFLPYMLQS